MKDRTMITHLILIVCLLVVGTSASLTARTSTSSPDTASILLPEKTLRYDTTTTMRERTISRKSLDEYYNDKEYAYDREQMKQDSLWDIIMQWLSDILGAIFGNKYGNSIGDALMYILIAVAVALVNIILFRSNLRGLFFKAKSRAAITFDAIDENIHELNFPALIAAAEENADYRRAVRLQYLWLLKRLADSETIDWKLNKTNRDYAHEIKDKALKRDFRRLSMIFDYVWYGDTTVDEESYSRTKELFMSVHQSAERHEITT